MADQVELQNSIDAIDNWCASNAMGLNVSKCQAIFFSRNELVHTCDYTINGTTLKVVNTVRDLGVNNYELYP